jgi:hypothetical protein
MWSSVATCLASTKGSRSGRMMTPVMKRSFVVTAAIAAIQISGSGSEPPGPPGSRPLGA